MKKQVGILLLALLVLSFIQYEIFQMEMNEYDKAIPFIYSFIVLSMIFAVLFFLQSLLFFTKRVNGVIEFRKDSLMAGFLKHFEMKRFCSSFWGFALMTVVLFGLSVYLSALIWSLTQLSVAEIDWSKLAQFVAAAVLVMSWVFLFLVAFVLVTKGEYELDEGQSMRTEHTKGYALMTFVTLAGLYGLTVPAGMTPALLVLFLAFTGGTVYLICYAFYWAGKKFLLWFEKTETGKTLRHIIEGSCPVVKAATE